MPILSWNTDRPGRDWFTLERGGGRALAWREGGDAHGRPVLYCHGFPSSRLESCLADDAACRHGLRLIAPDRPGLGRSDPAPGRSPAATAADLLALADHLGLARFAVLGVSAGGPYALALAARAPERVATVTCVAPLAPPAGTAGMHAPARLALSLAHHWPRLFTALVARLAGPVRRHPERAVRLLRPWLPAADVRLLAEPAFAGPWAAALAEGLRQGGAGAEDLVALVRRWDLDSAAVTAPVRLWHGLEDTQVPPSHSRWLAQRLPRARLHPRPGHGHFSLPGREADPILATLADDLEAAP